MTSSGGDQPAHADPSSTVPTPAQLDLPTALRVLGEAFQGAGPQATAGSVVRLALEYGRAERGLLILQSADGLHIEAEGVSSGGGIAVTLSHAPVDPETLPDSMLRHVLRTREHVLLDEAPGHAFLEDEYFRRRGARSAYCLPLLTQRAIIGVLYLERIDCSGVFARARPVLELLAVVAAISLEHARLNQDLRQREARLRRLVDSNIIGIAAWHADGRVLDINDAFLRIVGYSRDDLLSGRVRWTDWIPPEWHQDVVEALEKIRTVRTDQAHVREYIRKDGRRVPVLTAGALFQGQPDEGVGFAIDLTEHDWGGRALDATQRESRLIMDALPGLVGLLTATGEVEVVNRTLLDYFGQTLEELRHWATNGTVHPEDLPHVAETFARSIETGTPYTIRQRFRRSDGVYRWFENRGFPLRDPAGRIVRWCVLLTDVDERTRAEQALAASERNLKLTIDTIPALAWSTGVDGSADFFNQHYLEFSGLTEKQASGWGWTAAVHPEDLNGLSATWQRILTSGEQGEAEARLRSKDGDYRWFLFRASPLRDETGRIVKWFGVNTDIEDRKRAETELRRAYDSFADAQRLSHTGSFITDLVGDDHNWSEETYRIFEFDPGTEVTVQRIRDIIHPDDLPSFDSMIARAMSGMDVTFSFRIVTGTGALKHVRGVAHITEQIEGRPMFVGALQDVTESMLAEEALNKARSELARVARVTTLSTLTASIAHEVNQPLSGIATNAGTCLRMLDGDPPNIDGARETARRTIRDAHRASDVVLRLRALFSNKEFSLESLDVNAATREVIALSISELQRHRIVLDSELADDLPRITGDRIQLQQVILNLLRNAAEAMFDVNDRPRQLLIRTEREDDNHVRVSVRDAGVGFDLDSLNRLFDPFYTTKSEGMGIGLSVSRSIIERHHGRLWAEPNDGAGATFAFSIPCDSESLI